MASLRQFARLIVICNSGILQGNFVALVDDNDLQVQQDIGHTVLWDWDEGMSETKHKLRMGELPLGIKAEIIALDESSSASPLNPGELERRLIEMGLVEGAHVEVLHQGFPGRDPVAIRVNDHTVALRRSEANAVIVLRCPDGEA
jgi:ferrous iron transport protein A